MKKRIIRNQKGFTLIEIIAVLVILGILAAVAIPRYLDMIEESKNKATEGALGTAAGEVSLRFANAILASNSTPTMSSLQATLAASSQTLGDYQFTYAASDTSGITITVTAPTDKLGSPVTKTVKLQ